MSRETAGNLTEPARRNSGKNYGQSCPSSNTWPRCGALLLRNRSSWLTRSVPQNVASITAGMFHQILLVVFLRRIEFRCRRNFRRDWPVEFAGFVPPRLHAFGGLFLRLA